jgi:hypothetical protein
MAQALSGLRVLARPGRGPACRSGLPCCYSGWRIQTFGSQ